VLNQIVYSMMNWQGRGRSRAPTSLKYCGQIGNSSVYRIQGVSPFVLPEDEVRSFLRNVVIF
jgi:hypothetical protein